VEGQRGDDLSALDFERYPLEPMLERIWQLRENVSAYDAHYITLAETLGAPLLTFDAWLAGARGHTALVELLK
jgi:predicted nucleic acid-binding protein